MAQEPGCLSRQQVHSAVPSAPRIRGRGPVEGSGARSGQKLNSWATNPLRVFLVLLVNGAGLLGNFHVPPLLSLSQHTLSLDCSSPSPPL